MRTLLRNARQLGVQRWRLLLVVSLLALAVSALTYRPARPEFRVETRYIVSQPPLPSTLTTEEERYFTWVTSEYVVFGVSDWINGTSFAQRVTDRLRAQPEMYELTQVQVDALEVEEVYELLDSSAVRSRLVVESRGDDQALVRSVAAAAFDEILAVEQLGIPQFALPDLSAVGGSGTPSDELLTQLDAVQPVIVPLDTQLIVDEIQPPLVEQLALPLRLLLTVAAPLIVVLLLALRDKTIYGRSGVDKLGLSVLGEIPSG